MDPLLSIQDLSVAFERDEGPPVRAVDSVSLHVEEGEVLGLVGESGCGKSVTALSVLRLVPRPPGRIESGTIRFRGHDLLTLPIRELRKVRGGGIGMIFQEPMTALSPLQPVGDQLIEAVLLHRDIPRAEARAIAVEWLGRVGIPDPAERLAAYPYEFSGGMRQRVMIAMTLMLEPELVLADEPTTALDVTVQAQILDLMREMCRERASLVLITHDMGVIWEMCDRVVVMYASRLVEEAPVRELFDRPVHPYTEGLLRSVPGLDLTDNRRLEAIPGQVPPLNDLPPGCHFHDRCPYAFERCRQERPVLEALSDTRRAACFLAGERLKPRTPNSRHPAPGGHG